MTIETMMASMERVPTGFVGVCPATHPDKPDAVGLLVRNSLTGVYVLMAAGAMVSVPRKWAAGLAAGKAT